MPIVQARFSRLKGIMYGKHFASMYTGSMYGAGADLFAVWGYVISHVHEGLVELNPRHLAPILGMTAEAVEKAVERLCAPDKDSRSPENEGRRLVQFGKYAYHVTTHSIYRGVRQSEDRKDYMRGYMRDRRQEEAASKPKATRRNVTERRVEEPSRRVEEPSRRVEEPSRVSAVTANDIDSILNAFQNAWNEKFPHGTWHFDGILRKKLPNLTPQDIDPIKHAFDAHVSKLEATKFFNPEKFCATWRAHLEG